MCRCEREADTNRVWQTERNRAKCRIKAGKWKREKVREIENDKHIAHVNKNDSVVDLVF